MSNNLLITAITPHPPIIIPEVGGNEILKVKNTISSLKIVTERILKTQPDTIVIITPHSAFNPYYFSAHSGEKLRGNFGRFRAPNVLLEFDNDIELIKNLKGTSLLPESVLLDHGSAVPLYFLKKAGYNNKIAVINYTALGKEEHKNFGNKIVEAAEKTGRKIALIASGDLSHKLLPTAPAGYDERAHEFDEIVVESIRQGDYAAIENISPELRETAGECGYNSIMVALGAINSIPRENQVLSYEAPFGVGYVVGIF